MHKSPVLLCALFIFANTTLIHADILLLTNGDRMSGQIAKMENNKLTFVTPYSELSIPWSDIAEIQSKEPITLELSDNSKLKGLLVQTENGSSIKTPAISSPIPIAMMNVKAINPPVLSNEPIITGGVNVGGSKSTGNTDTQSFHADAKMIAQLGKDKFTAGAEYNQSANDGKESSNNLFIFSKYDHYITPDWYGFLFTDFTKDRFQDLNFRSAFGAGIGHEFWKTEVSFLSAEVGPAYVIEDYEEGEDREFIAGRWGLDFYYWVFEDRLQFFHNHIGTTSLEELSDVLVRSHTGFKYPIYQNFNLLTQVDVDYDNLPAEGKTSTDIRYIVGLGYNW